MSKFKWLPFDGEIKLPLIIIKMVRNRLLRLGFVYNDYDQTQMSYTDIEKDLMIIALHLCIDIAECYY